MRFLSSSLVLSFVLLLSGCLLNTKQSRVTTDYSAQVKSVGVVSLLSVQPNISYLSTSALESHFASGNLAGWNSDRLAHEILVNRMRGKGFSTRVLPLDGVLSKQKLNDWRQPLADSVSSAIYALGKSAGLDMVVVLQAQVGEDFVTGTNQKIRGYGLQRAFDTEAFIYASLFFEAYDIKKQFVVGRSEAQMSAAAPAGVWRADFENKHKQHTIDGIEGDSLRAALEDMLRNAIGSAAREAGL